MSASGITCIASYYVNGELTESRLPSYLTVKIYLKLVGANGMDEELKPRVERVTERWGGIWGILAMESSSIELPSSSQ